MGSGIVADCRNAERATGKAGGFVSQLERFGSGVELIGEDQAAEPWHPAVVIYADAKAPAGAVVRFDSIGVVHGWQCGGKVPGLAPGVPRGPAFALSGDRAAAAVTVQLSYVVALQVVRDFAGVETGGDGGIAGFVVFFDDVERPPTLDLQAQQAGKGTGKVDRDESGGGHVWRCGGLVGG